ncbi:MAG TPA: hypothetical protein VFP54_03885 [Acidimicrobiales bacterium]|nr:hypothetical protein [Acidimicrobiales bacterium]
MTPTAATRRRLAVALAGALTVWATGIGGASADTSPGPSVPTPPGDAPIHCPAEQYPHGGAPRSAPFVPYEIPFTATLGQKDPAGTHIGGYLQIANGPVTATLGGPVLTDVLTGQPYGSIFANACGVVQLPNESGAIPGNPYGTGGDSQYNNNFAFFNPIDVTLSITGFPGLPPVLSAYAADDGQLAAQILRTPAANGGLQVTFDANAKSTSDFGPAFSFLRTLGLSAGLPPTVSSLLGQASNSQGNSCTITIGNEILDGTPAADVRSGVTGLSLADATKPVTFTTQTSGKLSGRPVTGPVTSSNATLVANDFVVGKVDPSTVAAPQDKGAVCTQSSANTLNQLLNLPSVPNPATGHFPNSFYAPGTFAVYTSS